MNRTFLLIPLTASLVLAQGRSPADAGRSRPQPPIFKALDANQDGVIDAGELANASAALKKLDKNGDGKLSPDEYRPPRPDIAGPRPAERKGEVQPRTEAPSAKSVEPKPQGGPGSQDGGQRPPRPLIDSALDVNGDEIIDADEIAKAPARLKKLDANGDGKLSQEECFPRPAMKKGAQGETRK
jgi:hypothetical protein